MGSVKVYDKQASSTISALFVKKKKFQNERLWAYLFIAPIVLGVLIFEIGPIIFSFCISFTEWNGISKMVFVGFNNFVTLFRDARTPHEIVNTVIYTVVVTPCTLLLSLVVANLLNQGLKGTGVFRVIYFLPNVTMPVAVALVWKFLFNSKVGLVDLFLKVLHLPQPMWVGDPHYILWAIIIVGIWSGIGYNSVILLAGLQGIPTSLYEAADIDGAGSGTKMWKITIPLLTPTLFFLVITSIIFSLQMFDLVFIFNGGFQLPVGPVLDASRTLVYGIYEKAFDFLQVGTASAECIVLFVIIITVTLVQFALQKKWVYYE